MKISKGRLKQIIQEEMNRVDEAGFPDLTGDGKVTQADVLKGRGVELDEQVTPENMMLAMEALAKILANPVLAAGVASLLGKVMYDKLQAMAQKDAEVMAQRPELDEAQEA